MQISPCDHIQIRVLNQILWSFKPCKPQKDDVATTKKKHKEKKPSQKSKHSNVITFS